MNYRQEFSEADLTDLERIIETSSQREKKILSFWKEKWVRYVFWGLASILFLSAIALFQLKQGSYLFVFGCAIFFGVYPFILLFLQNEVQKIPRKRVEKIYQKSFLLSFEKTGLTYKETQYEYEVIRSLIEFEQFYFLYVNDKWLVIRADDGIKKEITKIVKEYPTIPFYKKTGILNLVVEQQKYHNQIM